MKNTALLDSFQNLIQEFDDSAFLGEIVATIADSVDQDMEMEEDDTKLNHLKKAIENLSLAVEHLKTFDEDSNLDDDWEGLLDEIFDTDNDSMVTMLEQVAKVLADGAWRQRLSQGNHNDDELDHASQHVIAAAGFLAMGRESGVDA